MAPRLPSHLTQIILSCTHIAELPLAIGLTAQQRLQVPAFNTMSSPSEMTMDFLIFI